MREKNSWNCFPQKLKKTTQKELSLKLSKILDNAEENMWKQVADIYHQETHVAEENFRKILTDFACNSDDIEKRLKNQELKCFESLQLVIKDKICNIDLLMSKKFNSHFEMDCEGVPRRWQPGEDVKTVWHKANVEAEKLVDLFSIIRLSEHEFDLHFFRATSTGIEAVTAYESGPQIPEKNIMITQKECERHLERFREQAIAPYRSALKEIEHATSQGRIPMYVILLLFILGWNELYWFITTLFTNPIGLFFMILSFVVALAIWRFNLLPVIKPIISMIFSEGGNYIKFKLYQANQSKDKMKTKRSALRASRTSTAPPSLSASGSGSVKKEMSSVRRKSSTGDMNPLESSPDATKKLKSQ